MKDISIGAEERNIKAKGKQWHWSERERARESDAE